MSDLDRKLAEAAAVAQRLKKSKWERPVHNGGQMVPPRRKDTSQLPEAELTPQRKQVLRKFMNESAKGYADGHAKNIREDINKILKEFEGDFDQQLHVVGDRIKDAQAAESELRKLFDEMRPKQYVIQHQDIAEELGELRGTQHYKMDHLIRGANVRGRDGHRKNILLKGPAGSGKTTGAVKLADAMGVDFTYIGQTLMPHQIEGYVRQGDGQYQETAFVRAFRDGGVLDCEEFDAWSPQAVLVANPALANGMMMLPTGEMIHRHPDCVIIACANTWGTGATAEYVGRNKMDAASLDRFGIRIDWGYDDQLERAAAGNEDLVTKVQTCRMNAERAGIKVLISPRASIDCADMVRCGFTEREAFELNLLSSLSADQRTTVLKGVELDD